MTVKEERGEYVLLGNVGIIGDVDPGFNGDQHARLEVNSRRDVVHVMNIHAHPMSDAVGIESLHLHKRGAFSSSDRKWDGSRWRCTLMLRELETFSFLRPSRMS